MFIRATVCVGGERLVKRTIFLPQGQEHWHAEVTLLEIFSLNPIMTL